MLWVIRMISNLLQALFQLLEVEVTLRCRKKDEQLIQNLLPECLNELEQQWGRRTKVKIFNEFRFISSFCFFHTERTPSWLRVSMFEGIIL